MARERKTIAGFSNFANTSDIDSKIKKENKNENKNDLLEEIKKPAKDDTHVFKGFYLEKDLARAIDKIADPRKLGKGAKSDLVNRILRQRFIEEGWL